MLGTHRAEPVLASPLCRAGREHGAAARGRLPHEPHRRGARAARSEHLVSMMQAAEVDEEFAKKHKVGRRRERQPVHAVRRGQSLLGPLVPARGAHQCALGAHGAHHRHVGDASTRLARILADRAARRSRGSRLPELLQWVKQVSHQLSRRAALDASCATTATPSARSAISSSGPTTRRASST